MTTHDETTNTSTDGTTGPEPTPSHATSHPLPGDRTRWGLRNFPPVEEWDHHTQSDPKTREPHDYMLVPTTCFNCESACGLLAYVDKSDLSIRKVEGNPAHPGSRGRNCAKGPATINQIEDPERILFPLKRTGKRGAGEWTRVSWDEALDDIGGRIRKAITEDRHNDVMYHVGRPGEDGFAERFLLAWGVDGHNSHTNICSAGARLGYSLWGGYDRPSPDYAHAKVVLLLSSHLETGHYFNPHAQRIMSAKLDGAKLIVMDPRLSNTASHADAWLTPWPGSEAALLLAVAAYLLREGTYDRDFLERWVNWRAYLENLHPDSPVDFEEFCTRLTEDYQQYTFEYAAEEADVPVEQVRELAEIVAGSEGRLSAHVWRSATAGNRGGWMVSRALMFLVVLTGSVGTKGGTSPNGWDKIIPHGPNMPGGHDHWNELTWPREYPLATNELSILLPHFLREGRGKLDVYFSRVYNPIWTNPDGFSWMETLTDEDRIGCHVALTPTWSETAEFADYILPMGHATERHDTHSYETHAGKWLGFRQPVRRVAMEKLGGTPSDGKAFGDSRDWNPGEVWEETEFWFELSWRIDPDGELGIRKYFESPTRPGERITVDEYYGHVFDHNVPGLPEKAAAEGLTPLQYMRRYGVVEVDKDLYRMDERVLSDAECEGATPDEQGVLRKPVDLDTQVPLVGEAGAVGLQHEDGSRTQGWLTPSRKLEIYSPSMRDWGWPEYATPGYIESHVSRRQIDVAAGERVLVPTFRLPTMIHTRSGNAKYLNEISNTHPLWTNTTDAEALGIATGDLVRISTRIGYFVARVWATEGIRPGVTALSHHMGRWRLRDGEGSRWSMGKVDLRQQVGEAGTEWRLRYTEGIKPFQSEDPDSGRIYWDDPGVHQNLTFPVQPDPWSGMHCWLQKVTVEKAHAEDEYGDVVVDTAKSREVYEEWIGLTRATLGPGGQRRPEFMMRPVMPQRRAYLVDEG